MKGAPKRARAGRGVGGDPDGKPEERVAFVDRQGFVGKGLDIVFRASLVLDTANPSLYGDRVAAYPMPRPYGHNIDDPGDWAMAERYLAARA